MVGWGGGGRGGGGCAWMVCVCGVVGVVRGGGDKGGVGAIYSTHCRGVLRRAVAVVLGARAW